MKDYEVEVLRVSTKSVTLKVKANTWMEAESIAREKAGDIDFNTAGKEVNVTYEIG